MTSPNASRPSLRAARQDDKPLLWAMLGHAANWDTARAELDVRATPEMAHYVQGWTPEQGGVVAEVDGDAVGAAWLRHLPPEDPGYGFWAPGFPELSTGIGADFRGQGIGRALIAALAEQTRGHGVPGISLSVEPGNRAAVALYERTGFRHTGRIVGDSEVMVMTLSPPDLPRHSGSL